MNCQICGSKLSAIETDLRFIVSSLSIVILKRLPVLQCDNCQKFRIEEAVMKQVEDILSKTNAKAELEVVYFAA